MLLVVAGAFLPSCNWPTAWDMKIPFPMWSVTAMPACRKVNQPWPKWFVGSGLHPGPLGKAVFQGRPIENKIAQPASLLCAGSATNSGPVGTQGRLHCRLQSHPAHPFARGGVRDHAADWQSGPQGQGPGQGEQYPAGMCPSQCSHLQNLEYFGMCSAQNLGHIFKPHGQG